MAPDRLWHKGIRDRTSSQSDGPGWHLLRRHQRWRSGCPERDEGRDGLRGVSIAPYVGEFDSRASDAPCTSSAQRRAATRHLTPSWRSATGHDCAGLQTRILLPGRQFRLEVGTITMYAPTLVGRSSGPRSPLWRAVDAADHPPTCSLMPRSVRLQYCMRIRSAAWRCEPPGCVRIADPGATVVRPARPHRGVDLQLWAPRTWVAHKDDHHERTSRAWQFKT
jgi:hypothetical protein